MLLWIGQKRFLWKHQTLFLAYISTEEGLQGAASNKNSIVLHPHPPWTVGPFTTFELAELPPSSYFKSWLFRTHLLCLTIGKVFGKGREICTRDMSPVPFHPSLLLLTSGLPHYQKLQCPLQDSSSQYTGSNLWFLYSLTLIHHLRFFSRSTMASRNSGGRVSS